MYSVPLTRNVASCFRFILLGNINRKYSNHVINIDNTLMGRLLKYLNNKTNIYALESVPAISANQLFNNTAQPSKIADAFLDLKILTEREKETRLKQLDAECCVQIENMNTQNMFHHLNYYMILVPNYIVQYKFYKLAMERLNNCLEFLTTSERLQFMFYVGLQKKCKETQKTLRKCLKLFEDKQVVNNLTIEDVCVICNSTFKTSTKISNNYLLEKIKITLDHNLHLLKDPALFITLIKTLRHNRYQDEDILSTITCTVLFNSTTSCYTFGGICHILAAYADYLYFDEPILKVFSEKCKELLIDSKIMPKRTYDLEYIRVKDIKRFLWAYSQLGYKLDKELLENVIVPKILERIKNGDYENEPETLMDCIFYMWILKYQAVELMPYCFTSKNIKTIRESKTKSKQRLNLLLTCMQLENRTLYKHFDIKPNNLHYFDEKYQLSIRPNLHRIYNALKELANKLEDTKFELGVQIPYLNILGIVGYKNNIYKSVFIEMLDDYVCVKNKDSFAYGPMQLKLRLLDDMDQALIIITQEDIKELNNKELQDYLEAEIKLVC